MAKTECCLCCLFSGARHIAKEYSNGKSLVKIRKYSIGNRYGSTSLIMNNKTFFRDVRIPNFEHDQGKETEIVSLGKLNNIKSGPLITGNL